MTLTNKAWYALRRTLPPWKFDELLEETIEYLPKYGIDEIILIIDTEEFFHGQADYQWNKVYQEKLFRLKEEMSRIGVRYSLNPWITIGHEDRGRDCRQQLPGVQTIIHPDGAESACNVCPLSEPWRENITKTWTLYAQTKPDVIWIEDDIRTFGNHACFCPLHLERFSQLIGKKPNRQELVKAILQPGKPHPWREKFLQMQSQIMTETVSLLAQTVHAVSPETGIGLMSSGPRNHCREGRQWDKLAQALTNNDNPIYSRPTMGNYWEFDLRGFYFSQDSVKITRHCMPENTIDFTEVENVPFSRYANSTTFTFLKMAVSFAYGARGVTTNIYDHLGTPMQAEPHYGKLLAKKKPFLEALASYTQKPGQYRGVRLLHHDQAGVTQWLEPNEGFEQLAEHGSKMMQALEGHGIPTTYSDSDVVTLTGQQARSLNDKTDAFEEPASGWFCCKNSPRKGFRAIHRPRCY